VDIAPEGFELVNGGKIFTPFWDKPLIYRPQMAVNWPPSSYDPTSNMFYVCGIDNLAISVADPGHFKPPEYRGMWLATGPLPFPQVARRGVFAAYDLKTNRIVWNQAWPEGCFSGSINTAGGLVFVGRSDGRLLALDKSNGHKLWEFLTDAGVNATASTFQHKGRQYVAVMSAGTLFGGGKKGDSVWLFSLAGKLESIPIAAVPPRIPGTLPNDAALAVTMPAGEPDLAHGKELFGRFCVACHGETGLGGHGGGASLAAASKDMNVIFTTASNGKNQNMPPFKGALKPEELRDIAGYISKELKPGS
jgi:mono/diheme cytochrome c family protein